MEEKEQYLAHTFKKNSAGIIFHPGEESVEVTHLCPTPDIDTVKNFAAERGNIFPDLNELLPLVSAPCVYWLLLCGVLHETGVLPSEDFHTQLESLPCSTQK